MEDTLLASVEKNIQKYDPVWKFPEEKSEFKLSNLWESSGLYATALAEIGVGKSSTVGILLTNRHEYVTIILAVWRLGAVAVPLRPVMGLSEDYEQYLGRVEHSCAFATIICETADDKAMAAAWCTLTGKQAISLKDLQEHTGKPFLERVAVSPSEYAVIQYSSGSTGIPKGVIVTHQMVLNQVDVLGFEYTLASGIELKHCASWLPFNHDMGLFIGILLPLYKGVDNILVSPRWYMMNPLRWFKLLAEHKTGLNFTTNAAMAHTIKLLGHSTADTLDLSRLDLYFGAEKVTGIVLRRAIDLLSKHKLQSRHIHVGYGMAENALGATSTKRSDGATVLRVRVDESEKLSLSDESDKESLEIVSIGEPFKGTLLEVRSTAGEVLPDLALGEIFVKGPCLTSGYLKNPEATQKALKNGWLCTNDIGFTYDGELFFHSRKDDLIIIGGRNIVPDDIEQCIESLENVRSGCTVVLSLENAQTGVAELHALIETKPLESADAVARRKEIQDLIFRSFALLLTHVYFCGKGSIEKTSSGKKRRKVIKERLINNSLTLFK